ncbi:MAG: UTP--glucose-1-phosphate uridylyltransferase [Verrucomicrobiae bacterium]|nr:UTP--glucose-1-phosphate uridylyltransferase [Verrucomicrobiae bacterium]
MDIKRAIITAAGKNQRTLPLQSIVDRDGENKTALAVIIEDVVDAGIEEIGLVIMPGDEEAFVTAAGRHARRLHFIEQRSPLGFGHAVWCAREFTAGEGFLLLVSDHLYVSTDERGCARQLVEQARAEDCSVSAVQATRENTLPNYGAIGGRLVAGRSGLYEISEVMEKPTPTQAEQRLMVPGMRAGHYLCFFGMHAMSPMVMQLLDEEVRSAEGRSGVHLSAALRKLSDRERYLAFEVSGRRYDIGQKYGLLIAQLALAMDGKDRDEVLVKLLELLATEKL